MPRVETIDNAIEVAGQFLVKYHSSYKLRSARRVTDDSWDIGFSVYGGSGGTIRIVVSVEGQIIEFQDTSS